MVRRKTHQEYATCFIPSSPTFDYNSSRAGMLAMVFKLTKTVEQKWRTLKGYQLLAQVVKGVKFNDGLQEEAHQVAA